MCKQPRPALTECSRFCPLFLNNSKRKGPPPDSENLGWLEIDRPHRRRGLMKRPWNVFAAMLCANNRALSWQIVAVSVRFHRNHSKRTSSHLMAGACSFGWAGWNRTSTGRVKVCCPTTRLHPNLSSTGQNRFVYGNEDTQTVSSFHLVGVDNRIRTDGLQCHKLAR